MNGDIQEITEACVAADQAIRLSRLNQEGWNPWFYGILGKYQQNKTEEKDGFYLKNKSRLFLYPKIETLIAPISGDIHSDSPDFGGIDTLTALAS